MLAEEIEALQLFDAYLINLADENEEKEQLIERVEKALYRAKHLGQNRIEQAA